MLLLCLTKQRLDAFVTAFTAYHAAKLEHRTAVAKAGRTGEHLEVHSLMASVARAHSVKSGLGQLRQRIQGVQTSLDVGLVNALSVLCEHFGDFCEPECNDFADGEHHPCCSQAHFKAETQPANREQAMTQLQIYKRRHCCYERLINHQ